LNILGLNIDNVNYIDLLKSVSDKLNSNETLVLTYANTHTLNLTYQKPDLLKYYTAFNLVHPDGIGVYFASKILYGKNGFKERITGSDFYIQLKKLISEKNLKLFIFGDTQETLNKVLRESSEINNLQVKAGFDFDTGSVIESINSFAPDILLIGLGAPLQEKWVYENLSKLNYKIIICVGEGIRIFSGTKVRGPEFLRKLGLEWLVRYLSKPAVYFKRYIIGNPLFIFRILKQKFNGV